MKSKFLFSGAAFLLILSFNGWAADIPGTWIAKIPIKPMPNAAVFPPFEEVVMHFKADGKRLTGTISDSHGKTAINDGVIDGDTISFTTEGGAGANGTAMEYTGDVGLNEIRFTRKPKDGSGQPLEFFAKREFLRHNDYIQRPIAIPEQQLPRR